MMNARKDHDDTATAARPSPATETSEIERELAAWAARNVPASHFDLSFIQRRKRKGANFWAVEPSGNYVADYERGEMLGVEYLAYVGRHRECGNVFLLGWVVDAMLAARGESLSGLELGFLSRVNRFATTAAWLMDREAKRVAAASEPTARVA